MNAENGKIVIVKNLESGLLGAVVCPEGTRGVVFENGEWIVDTREMDLHKVGEAAFRSPYEGDGKIPSDGQRKYTEAALASINLFKEGENNDH